MEIIICDEFYVADIAYLESVYFSRPWQYSDIKDAMRNDHIFFGAIDLARNLHGYGAFKMVLGEAYVDNIVVDEKYRKKGVATAIINKMIEYCIEHRASFITLEVRESNTTAISLYEKMGFEKVGVRKNFYSAPTENAILYTLQLKEGPKWIISSYQ